MRRFFACGAILSHPGPLPLGEGESSSASRNVGGRNFGERSLCHLCRTTAVPSPWGEGQGEGEPFGPTRAYRSAAGSARPAAAASNARYVTACCDWCDAHSRAPKAACQIQTTRNGINRIHCNRRKRRKRRKGTAPAVHPRTHTSMRCHDMNNLIQSHRDENRSPEKHRNEKEGM